MTLDTSLRFPARFDRSTGQLIDGPVSGIVSTFFDTIDALHARGHSGVDVVCAHRTPMRTLLAGTVKQAFTQDPVGVGNFVTIDHGDNLTSSYWHLDEVHVQAGQLLSAGEHIGLAGATGEAYEVVNTNLGPEYRRNTPGATHLHWMCGPTNRNPWMSNQRELWNALDLLMEPPITPVALASGILGGLPYVKADRDKQIYAGAVVIEVVFPMVDNPGPSERTDPAGLN